MEQAEPIAQAVKTLALYAGCFPDIGGIHGPDIGVN
jgi:hypothetical protein